jgi:hypothetical protein
VNKHIEYKQLTVRLPRGLYQVIEEESKVWGLTLQDTIIYMLLVCVEGDKSE